MRRKVLSVLLACTMAFGLAACGSSATSSTPAADADESVAAEEEVVADDGAEEATVAEDVDYGSGTITIWVAEEVGDFTKTQAEQFIADHPEFSGYTVNVEAVGEGDAASNMITDVEGGADIFGFAQDQMARLVAANAVMEVLGDYADFVSTSNDEGAVSAAKMGDSIYAFPITSDNGYFLYYDSTVVSDPSTLEGIVADCEAAGKNFYMEINSGWYMPAFFFGTGCTLTYDTDSEGNFVASDITYTTDAGVKAMKAIVELSKSPAFVNGSSVSNATNLGAIIDGTWDSSAAKELIGEGYACAKLPTFTVDGETYQMSGFGGFKLLGVKPQTDTGKAVVCLELAKYLSSAEVQVARYNEVGWGPSNLEAQQNEAVQADEALSALGEQLAFTIPQGQYPNDFWTLSTALGDDIIADKYDNASDEELLSALEEFQATCESYVEQ